eukprot:scaffold169704_cov19-Tisochrysis_lutea.AAC.2
MDARSGPTVVPLPLLSPGLPGWRGFPQLSCSMQHNSNNLIAGRHEEASVPTRGCTNNTYRARAQS